MLAKLFGEGPVEARAKLNGPLPDETAVPMSEIRAYVPLALSILDRSLNSTRDMVPRQVQLIQGLRLLIIEKACAQREVPVPGEMLVWLRRTKMNSDVVKTLRRERTGL